MALDPQTAQRLVTALLNLAVAVLVGASVARLWLGRDPSGWAGARREPVRKAAVAAAVVALVAAAAWLWLESAAMAEVPVAEAASATWLMIHSTHLGSACCVGLAALAVATAGAYVRGACGPGPALLTLAGLAVFWYTRSMVSHASSDGDVSMRLLADWLHLGLVSLWVGEVIVAAALVLHAPAGAAAGDRRARAAYIVSLSNSATMALTGIVVTGVYAAWRGLGGWPHLIDSPYGKALAAKVLLVGAAAALGGLNRFFVMPPWLAHACAGDAAAPAFPARFRRILWLEALVLLAVVVLAAWLASTPPPGEPA